MNKENCLIYEADNESTILFDFNNIDIENALNKINNDNIQSLFCIGLNEDDIALNGGVEARIEVDSNIDDLEIIEKKDIKNALSELNNHYKNVPSFEMNLEYEETLNEEPDKIVKRKNLDTKPMDEDEAIMQMELLNHDFFTFKNINEECVSVLYKRKDGSLGIINVK